MDISHSCCNSPCRLVNENRRRINDIIKKSPSRGFPRGHPLKAEKSSLAGRRSFQLLKTIKALPSRSLVLVLILINVQYVCLRLRLVVLGHPGLANASLCGSSGRRYPFSSSARSNYAVCTVDRA